MRQEGLLIMSTQELERVRTIQRVIDKKITQMIAAQHLAGAVKIRVQMGHFPFKTGIQPLLHNGCSVFS